MDRVYRVYLCASIDALMAIAACSSEVWACRHGRAEAPPP